MTIQAFQRLCNETGFEVVNRRLYFINPHYEKKFGLKPRKLWGLIACLPYIRDFFSTSCHYLIKMKELKKQITRQPNTYYASTDGGFIWETFYVIETQKPIGVFNICMKDSLLAIYTLWDNQAYLLDVDAVENSISPVENERKDAPYYDLQGRKVANPTRGINIKDRKKVIIGQ